MDRLYKYLFLVVVLGLVGAIVFGYVKEQSHQAELRALRNQLAAAAETITIKDGLYSRLAVEHDDLKSLLSSKDSDITKLKDELKKSKDDILSVSSLVVKWKSAYQSIANAKQTELPSSGPTSGPSRLRVDFDKDFGPFIVSGYTLTDPAYAWLMIKQGKPLRLTLALTQQKDKSWRTLVSSSDENVTVDVAISAVNPLVLQPKWYEKISFDATVAGGSTQSGFGALLGLGVSYKLGPVSFGPAFFLGISKNVDMYGGLNVKWFPFEKSK